MTATDVQKMIDRGVPQTRIVSQLESTGIWSEAGAKEIVRFMTAGPDSLLGKHIRLVRHPRRAVRPREADLSDCDLPPRHSHRRDRSQGATEER